jgi:phosphatidylserine/phosphatidylglycerophosphate/cardiolipin synthase-like enzyme
VNYRIALILAFLLILVAAVALAAGDPLVLFTDNVEATGTVPAATVMEQALLDRIDGAASSIDVAIYDFNRTSARDALIAAHGRGVVVRVVTDDDSDDDSYEDDSYHPFYAASEAAGIGVVDEGRSSIMHNKFFVIDGEMVWTGSTNITDRGFTLNHNNSTVMTSTLLADI